MTSENLLRELLSRYGDLPGQKALDAIERAIARALEKAFKIPFTVRLNSKLGIWMIPPNGAIEEFTERKLNKRLRRNIIFEIENELRVAQVLREYDNLQSLQGKVVPGVIRRISADGNVLVEMELTDLFERYILMGVCPLRFQPPHERKSYFLGETRMWYVTSVSPVAGHNHARVLVQLSRATMQLPAILLSTHSGIDKIKCIRRIPGGESHVVTHQRIPRGAITAVIKELKENVRVQVLS